MALAIINYVLLAFLFVQTVFLEVAFLSLGFLMYFFVVFVCHYFWLLLFSGFQIICSDRTKK